MKNNNNDYQLRNKEKSQFLDKLKEKLKNASTKEKKIKLTANMKEQIQEIVGLDDEIKSAEKDQEAVNDDTMELKIQKSKLENELEQILKQKSYYEHELLGIEKEIKEKRVCLAKAKYDLEYCRARERAKAKICRLFIMKKRCGSKL